MNALVPKSLSSDAATIGLVLLLQTNVNNLTLCFVQLSDEKVQKMYEVLELHKSTYLTVFKDIYADVKAGRFG